MLPNRNTIGLAALLGALWYAGASQGNAAAYLLGFVLAGMALVSIVHVWSNVRGVTITAEPLAAVFVGDEFRVRLTAKTLTRRSHPGLRVQALDGSSSVLFGEVAPDAPQRAELPMLAEQRGLVPAIELQMTTLYPLGFFTATRSHRIVQPRMIYPKAEGSLPLPISPIPARRQRDGLRVEGDDFAGTRAYRIGESQRHIDWKAAARGQPLLVKQWAGEADETLHFDWHELTPLAWEARLSQLARWIVLAERRGANYGLRLPGQTLDPAAGELHFHACLRALALFPAESETGEPDGV